MHLSGRFAIDCYFGISHYTIKHNFNFLSLPGCRYFKRVAVGSLFVAGYASFGFIITAISIIAVSLKFPVTCNDFLETTSPSDADVNFVFSDPSSTRAALNNAYELWRSKAFVHDSDALDILNSLYKSKFIDKYISKKGILWIKI